MSESIAGKLAVVTGAGRGIGREIAVRLAGAGAEVVLVSRDRAALDAVADTITAGGGAAHVVSADVSSAADVDRVREQVSSLGRAGVLVNAAGVFGPIQPIVDTAPDEWMSTIQINLFGAYLMSRALVPAMITADWGRVLNLTSAASLHEPGPMNSAYATSKVALNQFTRHLAAELAGTGVTANVFHPGDVKTEMWASIRDQVAAAGPRAADFAEWVAWVDETGGDPISKAADLVLEVVADGSGPHGQFLWIDDPLQPAITSWSGDDAAPPTYVNT